VLKSEGLSTDGLHFNGPANDITISNCDFTTGDDAIALNCPEGYSGDISRVSVTGCTFNSLSLMRLYTANGYPNKFKVDTVSVSGCTGTLSEAAFLIGLIDGSLPDSVASLSISDCHLTGPCVLGVAENFGVIALKNVTFVPSQANVVWVPPQSNHVCALLRPSPLYGGVTFVGSSLSFENCRIRRVGGFYVTALILDFNSIIGNVAFNGFGIEDVGPPIPVPDLIDFESGSVGQIVLNSLNSNNIHAPVSVGGFANVGSISGTGVLATGWEFPDSVMADGVPYISASSGMPSVKVGGVVQPYVPG
jgi:hypothetical protein